MYYIYGVSVPSLLIESTDSVILKLIARSQHKSRSFSKLLIRGMKISLKVFNRIEYIKVIEYINSTFG